MVTSSTFVFTLGIHGGSTGCKYGMPTGGDGRTNSMQGGDILSKFWALLSNFGQSWYRNFQMISNLSNALKRLLTSVDFNALRRISST